MIHYHEGFAIEKQVNKNLEMKKVIAISLLAVIMSITVIKICKFNRNKNDDKNKELTVSDANFKIQSYNGWGLVDTLGKNVTECKYDNIYHLNDKFYAAKFKGKMGIINNEDQEITELIYDDVESIGENIFKAVSKGTCKIIGLSDKYYSALAKAGFDSCDLVSVYPSGLLRVERNEQADFLDDRGNIVSERKYDKIDILDIAYDADFISFSSGMIGVKLNLKYGFIDSTGKEVVKCKYDFAEAFKGDVTVALKDKNWFIIDKKGNEIKLSKKYSRVTQFVNGIAEVITNCSIDDINYQNAVYTEKPTCGYINTTGKEIVPLIYDYECYADAYSDANFAEGLALVCKNDKYGFIEKNGKQVIALKYQEAQPFVDGLALVKSNNKWGFINKKGKEVIAIKYDSSTDFSEGFAAVEISDKWGFVDKTGKEITSIQYDGCTSFSHGLAAVKLNNKWGFIDKKGKVKIPIIYDETRSFINGVACVKLIEE